MDSRTILENMNALADEFAQDRHDRQLRRQLDPADFDRIKETGFLLTGVPRESGGIWENVSQSVRPICEMVRTLAGGDSSVALVSSMHPAVLSFWLATPSADSAHQAAWDNQRDWIFETARDGAWWGTITSEPGSGGDITRTKSVAQPDDSSDQAYKLTGQKHFGSGSGIMSYMITTALPAGKSTPDLFFMDVRDVPWDGSAGITLTAPWDGHGMIATQSHSMQFQEYPLTRSAWPGHITDLGENANPFITCLFSSVIAGIAETAYETARCQVQNRKESLSAYDQVEWTRTVTEVWLIRQAYEGMLRAVEADKHDRLAVLAAKTVIAELAESVTRRICRVLGGGTFSRHNPFGFWFEDVRALGFLRPPWSLAYGDLFETSLESAE